VHQAIPAAQTRSPTQPPDSTHLTALACELPISLHESGGGVPKSSSDVDELAADVERYLVSHPGAADTVEGIARWWLVRARAEALRPNLESALEQLIARGLLVRRKLPDGNVVYARKASAPAAPGGGGAKER
jgi:hypothetical protein